MPEIQIVPGPLQVNGPLRAATGVMQATSGAGLVGVVGLTQTIRRRFTTAEMNAGQTLLPALPYGKYRLVDFVMIAVGGAAATATSVRIAGTQATSVVQLVTVLVAALTQGTWVRPNSANVTMLTDGAAGAVCDQNTAITVNVNANNLATATHIDFIVTVAVELP